MERVNMRAPNVPVVFVDTKLQQAYEAECEAARATQCARFAVAPRQQVPTPDGRTLTAGQPISHADLHGSSESAWQLLARHVRAGRVLESHTVREPVTTDTTLDDVVVQRADDHAQGPASNDS